MLYLSENDDICEVTKRNAIPGFLHFHSWPWFGKKSSLHLLQAQYNYII